MTLSSGKWFLTFRKIDVASSSESVTVFQNIGNHSLGDMVSRPTRLEYRTYLCVFVYVASIDDKNSNYLWCPNALRNAGRNSWLSCFVSEITPRDKMHSNLLYFQHPSATLIQERLLLRGSSTTPSGSKHFSQGKILDLRWSYLVELLGPGRGTLHMTQNLWPHVDRQC
jgi:hypothetical protein